MAIGRFLSMHSVIDHLLTAIWTSRSRHKQHQMQLQIFCPLAGSRHDVTSCQSGTKQHRQDDLAHCLALRIWRNTVAIHIQNLLPAFAVAPAHPHQGWLFTWWWSLEASICCAVQQAVKLGFQRWETNYGNLFFKIQGCVTTFWYHQGSRCLCNHYTRCVCGWVQLLWGHCCIPLLFRSD